MTIDVSGYMLAIVAIGISFVASRSTYWILKFMAGLFWWVVALFWVSNAPAGITKGSPEDIAIIIALFFVGIAFMLMPLWYTKLQNGREIGGRLRLPFMRNDEQEEEERMRRYLPSRSERVDRYVSRLESALRGERRHK